MTCVTLAFDKLTWKWYVTQKTTSLQCNNCLLCPYSQSSLALFVCNPNFGQAVIRMFNCLSIDKEEITVSFPRWWVTSAHIDQAQIIPKGFIPKIKSGSHICISTHHPLMGYICATYEYDPWKKKAMSHRADLAYRTYGQTDGWSETNILPQIRCVEGLMIYCLDWQTVHACSHKSVLFQFTGEVEPFI